LIALIAGVFILNTPAFADDESNGPGPVLKINRSHGDTCVEPEEVMRKNHMKFLLHQRDETMHEGIRTSKYSFAECINCHVEPDENGNIASVDSKDHFCNGCHEYAAVTIDCFECHADRPQKFIKRGGKSAASLQSDLQQMLSASEDTGGELK
jgi:hypothetical protein